MNRYVFGKTIAMTLTASVLTASVLTAGCAWAADGKEPAEQETVVAKSEPEMPEVKVYGKEGKNSVKFDLVNMTGKDITYLSIFEDDNLEKAEPGLYEIQEALIELGFLNDFADGEMGPNTEAAILEFREKNNLPAEPLMDEELLKLLFGPVDDGNILGEDEVIKDGENVIVYCKLPANNEEEGETETGEADPENAEYAALFHLDGDEKTEYILHSIPVDDTRIKLFVDKSIAYVEFKAGGNGDKVSTLEAEKTIFEKAEAAAKAAEEALKEQETTTEYSEDIYYEDVYYEDEYSGEVYEEEYVYEETVVYEDDADAYTDDSAVYEEPVEDYEAVYEYTEDTESYE